VGLSRIARGVIFLISRTRPHTGWPHTDLPPSHSPYLFPLDIVTVTIYYEFKENANMEIGDTVKFIDGLYPEEKGARYKVIEINGDRAIIEFICDLPIPPQSIAKTNELEFVQ
jgi:hypothetical protein